jgi:hypothetical protein
MPVSVYVSVTGSVDILHLLHLLAFDIASVIVTVMRIDWRRSLGYFGKLILIFASKQAHVVADDVVTFSDIAYTSRLLDGISCKIEHLLIKFHRSRDEYLVVGSRQQQTILSVTNVTQVGSAHCLVVKFLGIWDCCKGDTAKHAKLADIRHNAICSFMRSDVAKRS